MNLLRKENLEACNDRVIPFPNIKKKEYQIEDVLNNYGDSIFRLSFSYLHNKEDAEDILQDTLIQFLKVKPSFNNEEHLKAWLFRVAINLSKNKIKSNNVRRADNIDDLEIVPDKEDFSFVWEAVKKLPMKYREVIHLYYYEGYSIQEISKILGKNIGTIKSLLSRGRKLLEKDLKGGV